MRAALLVIALAALVLVPDAQAANRPHSTCRPPHSQRVADNGHVRVFLRGEYTYYACSRRSRRWVVLGIENGSSSCVCTVRFVRLRGEIVAAEDWANYPGGSTVVTTTLNVFDVRRGRRLYSRNRSDAQLEQLVLGAHGSVAWLEVAGERHSVRRHDSRGFAVLDSGTGDGAPTDLRLKGAVLRWLAGGAERTATLR